MKKERDIVFLWILLLGVTIIGFPFSMADSAEYPTKPITIFCGYAAGGQTDLIVRLLAKGLEKHFKTAVVVDNRVGGGGVIAGSALAHAKPDGYTLADFGDSQRVMAHLLARATYSKDDYIVVGQFVYLSNVMAVKSDAPWPTMQAFIEYAKKTPGLTYGHSGVGSTLHIKGEYLKKLASINMEPLPFNGDGATMAALLGGHIPIGVFGYGTALTQVDAGKARIIFSFDPPGLKMDPSVPNVQDLFGKDAPFVAPTAECLVAPAKTPAPIVKALEGAVEKVTKDPEFIENARKMMVGIHFADGKTVLKDDETKADRKSVV